MAGSVPRQPEPEDFSIGYVAEATGITPETLRVWERRYGRPEALRLPSGHRRYTAEQVRWLRRVAEALARGHRPHKVVPLDETALDALLAPMDRPVAVSDELDTLLGLARAFDAVALRARLIAAWDPDRHLEYLEDTVAPLIRLVGRAWADGDLEIRHEHFLSEIVEDVLRGARTDFPLRSLAPRILLTTLPGETHGLGLQMAALCCAAHAVPTRLLGVDSPLDEIVEASVELDVDLVAVSVSLATGGVDTDRLLADLRRRLPADAQLVVGGSGARGVRRGPRGIVYVESLAAWDDLLRALPTAA